MVRVDPEWSGVSRGGLGWSGRGSLPELGRVLVGVGLHSLMGVGVGCPWLRSLPPCGRGRGLGKAAPPKVGRSRTVPTESGAGGRLGVFIGRSSYSAMYEGRALLREPLEKGAMREPALGHSGAAAARPSAGLGWLAWPWARALPGLCLGSGCLGFACVLAGL